MVRRDQRAAPAAVGARAAMPALASPVFAHDLGTMIGVIGLTSFVVGFHLGPIFAIPQRVARPAILALSSALVRRSASAITPTPLPFGTGGSLPSPKLGDIILLHHEAKAALDRGRERAMISILSKHSQSLV